MDSYISYPRAVTEARKPAKNKKKYNKNPVGYRYGVENTVVSLNDADKEKEAEEDNVLVKCSQFWNDTNVQRWLADTEGKSYLALITFTFTVHFLFVCLSVK